MNDDRVLIGEILNGNQAAFQTFIERYQKLVSHVVFRMISHEADREDLCQDVFIKLYTHLDGFRFDCKLSTWIARIAYNTCLNYLEKKRVSLLDDLTSESESDVLATISSDQSDPAALVEDRDLASRVQQEINALPPRMGVLLVLYHLEEMSYEEIARVLELPMGTVKSYLYRARKMLKDQLLRKYRVEEICQSSI